MAVYNCGVNASDILTCQGVYENLPRLPFVPGFEFSGEVTEVSVKVRRGSEEVTAHQVTQLGIKYP